MFVNINYISGCCDHTYCFGVIKMGGWGVVVDGGLLIAKSIHA